MPMIPAATYDGQRCAACSAFPRGRNFHCGDCHATFAAKSQAINHEDFHYLILKDRCPTAEEMARAGLWTKTTGLLTEVWHGRISRIDMQLATADLSEFDEVERREIAHDHRGEVVEGSGEPVEPMIIEVIGGEEFVEVGPPPGLTQNQVATPSDVAKKLAKLRAMLAVDDHEKEVGMINAVKFQGAFDFGKHGFHRYATGDTWVITEGEGIKIKAYSWASAAREYGDWNNFKTEVKVFTDDLDGKTKVALRYTDLLNKDFKR